MSKLTPDVIFTTNYGGGIRNETQFQQSTKVSSSMWQQSLARVGELVGKAVNYAVEARFF